MVLIAPLILVSVVSVHLHLSTVMIAIPAPLTLALTEFVLTSINVARQIVIVMMATFAPTIHALRLFARSLQ
jgi:hypothetical protein